MTSCRAALVAALVVLCSGCTGEWPEYRPGPAVSQVHRRKGLKSRSIEEVLTLPDHEIDMARAALLLAAEMRPGISLRRQEQAIADLVAEAAREIGTGGSAREAVEELNGMLLIRRGVGYYRARSESDFDVTDVIANRRGNCLNSTLLYLAVSDRLGLDVHAVMAPGHVFMRYDDGLRKFNIEPTQAGRSLPDLRYKVVMDVSRPAKIHGVYLRTLSKREFLAEFLAARGGFWAARGRYQMAERDLSLALAVQPVSAQALVNLGYLAERTGNLEKARNSYRQVLTVDSRNAAALNNLAGLLVANPGGPEYAPDEARRLVNLALRHAGRGAPERIAAFLDTAGRVAAAQEDWRDASRYARKACRLVPGREDYRQRASQYTAKAIQARRNRDDQDSDSAGGG